MTCLFLTLQSLPLVSSPSNVLHKPSRSLHNPLFKLSPVSASSLTLLLRLICNYPPTNKPTRVSVQASFFAIPSPAIRAFCSKGSVGMGDGAVQHPDSISYLTQREAAEIDEILMGPLGFSVDQLMVHLKPSICYPILPPFICVIFFLFPVDV